MQFKQKCAREEKKNWPNYFDGLPLNYGFDAGQQITTTTMKEWKMSESFSSSVCITIVYIWFSLGGFTFDWLEIDNDDGQYMFNNKVNKTPADHRMWNDDSR